MKDYKSLINRKKVPSHVAIIMDGNGRWAKKKSLPRSEGHKRGAEIIEPLMDTAIDLGIKAVSLYAFSTENWRRPRSEVLSLWKLLDYFFRQKIGTLKEKGIQVRHSGLHDRLPSSSLRTIQNAIMETKGNKRLVLNFCLNYGGQQDIVQAVNGWLDERKRQTRLTTGDIEKRLFTAGMPPVDLMIRTGGESRISNFLIWQLAYAELMFMDVLWPDFRPAHLYRAIYEFQQRERRFGGL
ncbi:MAG TPA: polyprenyl diphosphate synthase [Spirochaetota bacterium]|nr:polyprenyl diphosphate synthase [Spirochaetota bacterium]HPC43339.1 polyprenyl diphosphate synthase [Spirochaetota bacterium]HPL17503.1 polyprenyl diphosphate synthase [Spirochaetota bacterium]HQF06940.1 polyprenyl diphosphate synthase [Spirochaetota bacterium]HQH95677.1 polyprenyl diphosphate synthase [Spirochaetota bacterium]